jgi:saccharopine dehydrogenase-like NADP-dependent oxidoreductase
VVTGEVNGRKATLRADTWAWPHPEWNISGSKLMVASPPAIVARWLADGSLSKPGVWAPEQAVDGDRFFAALSERGAGTSLSRQQVLHEPKVAVKA